MEKMTMIMYEAMMTPKCQPGMVLNKKESEKKRKTLSYPCNIKLPTSNSSRLHITASPFQSLPSLLPTSSYHISRREREGEGKKRKKVRKKASLRRNKKNSHPIYTPSRRLRNPQKRKRKSPNHVRARSSTVLRSRRTPGSCGCCSNYGTCY